MLNFIPTSFSNKLTPGSPDCIFSTKRAVDLQINMALIKATIGAAVPIIFKNTHTMTSYDGKEVFYRGASHSPTGNVFGRGVAYEGSVLSPKTVSIGRFETNGYLKEGYIYQNNESRTARMACSGESRIVNIVTSKGEYVRGIVPAPKNMGAIPNLQHKEISQQTNEGLPLPIQGGEMFGTAYDGNFYKGTFQPDGTFTGSISNPSTGSFSEGAFLFKMLADGSNLRPFRQISGTHTSGDIEGGGTFTYKSSPSEDERQGTVVEGRMTYSNGSFKEGLFHLNEMGIPTTQLSGNFEERHPYGAICTGKILNKETFEGQIVFPDGSFRAGVFLRTMSADENMLFLPQISGTFKWMDPKGDVVEGEILGNNKFKGSHTKPNGSVIKGEFSIMTNHPIIDRIICFVKGTCKIIQENGSIIEGFRDKEDLGKGTLTMPGKQPQTGILMSLDGHLCFMSDTDNHITYTNLYKYLLPKL